MGPFGEHFLKNQSSLLKNIYMVQKKSNDYFDEEQIHTMNNVLIGIAFIFALSTIIVAY